MPQKIVLKIITLGSSKVGKTSLLQQYFDHSFNQNLLSTIGIDFRTKYFKFNDKKIRANFVDTAGQEKFHSICLNYIKGSTGALLVFDITSQQSFNLLDDWVDQLNKSNFKQKIPVVLVGNKVDLSDDREISEETAKDFAKKLGCNYYETSAKTGINVNKVFEEITSLSYEFFCKSNGECLRDSIQLDGNNNNKNKNKKCCVGGGKRKESTNDDDDNIN